MLVLLLPGLLGRQSLVFLEHLEILQLELPDVHLPLVHQFSLVDPVAQLFQLQLTHHLPDHVLDPVVFVLL